MKQNPKTSKNPRALTPRESKAITNELIRLSVMAEKARGQGSAKPPKQSSRSD